MATPSHLTRQGADTLVSVKVTPRASRNEIGEPLGNELKIKIAAPPVDSAANEELVEFLAKVLGCSRGAVHLQRGQTSRHKVLRVTGMAPEECAARLDKHKQK
jgi:uncharacterized protein (TIGR00251 family)